MKAKKIFGLVLLVAGLALVLLGQLYHGAIVFFGILSMAAGAYLAWRDDAKPDAGGFVPTNLRDDDD